MTDTAEHRAKPTIALRAAGLCAVLALLLAACGEQAPEGEQQGSISPPAATDQSSAG